ncbi:MAG: 2-oxoacid:acceptor oxidoreductase family protein [Candidatus Cloacimonetes bacterium]|nr:2-oxoacid:acceptor oxidoreductase family protein [Candidatus Cloacimonadota bacterium]
MQNKLEKGIETRLSGSGGQGLILSGIIMAKAAVLDGLKVTQTQSYGPESRGGASRADVIISVNDIYYPEATHLDFLVALTQEACDKYIYELKEKGILIADNSFVKNISVMGPRIFDLPFSDIAMEKLGSRLPTNIVVLGFLVAISKLVSKKSLESAVKSSVKPAYLDLNMKALSLGFTLAAEALKEIDMPLNGGSK